MESENKKSPLAEVGKERHITLSPKMYKIAVASLGIGALLFLGTCGYSIYSALNYQNNQAAIKEMQESNQLQQEQLLNLSKKASQLSEQLQNLTRMETDLRIQAGIKPPKDVEEKNSQVVVTETPVAASETAENPQGEQQVGTDESADFNGQGGPVGDLTLSEVEKALAILETNMNTRKESLYELQTILKTQRAQMMIGVTMQPGAQVDPNVANMLAAGGLLSTNTSTPGISGGISTIPSMWPSAGEVSSPYGLRWGGSDFHPGIDIANELGTPIVATADGTVEYAGWNSGGYGNMVDINHGNGLMTRYGHASQVLVSNGQQVKRGQIIALMGSTGFSTGPHVHYEVHVNGQQVNPISYL